MMKPRYRIRKRNGRWQVQSRGATGIRYRTVAAFITGAEALAAFAGADR
ncbi:hypothetical protein SEA_REPTAR3000_62 [Mycobacterium phage Reptar3000]|uniref:Uncharacterized protein n=5 Tax=Fionnbharthvirus TaxID=2948708 RepID=A0A6G6XTV1_9CAUD|nr:hypothetical protein I5G69_gp70 [Mycobacterium phage Eponine]AVR77409.1 hypothetical protein SEA_SAMSCHEPPERS_63 [Mycobacterium phage SamScheppers]AYQ98547.1 hypothetical protein SEA_REPTAR3000_62 [Mycobacterium phage Reptar3000]QIG61876.1 hypothetical protein SEA_EPONINE_67 [Mycobacterium phage Eponine]